MKLSIFSDIHADYEALQKIMGSQADYYFAAGDLVNWAQGLERVGPILAQQADRTYVLPGNHESEQDVAELCRNYHLHEFHGRDLQIGSWRVAGLGYSNPTPFDTPGEYSEAELAARLAVFAHLKPLIMICHCPPKETALDQAAEGAHFGSTAVREFIEQAQPHYFFCGHIHEAEGAEQTIGRTKCMNVGKKGYLLEL